MEERLEMEHRVEKTTRKYTAIHGMIQCNRGDQENQVRALLESHGYAVDDAGIKKSRAMLMFVKKESLEK